MSELKAIDLGNIRESIEKDKPVYYEYYAKSEADKVIAHNKYKRCLCMAGRCEDRLKTIQAGVIRTYEYPYMMSCPAECNPTYHFYKRWQKRWLALADEPTWAKFLQLIHKEAK